MTAEPAVVVLGPSGLDAARRIAGGAAGRPLHGPRAAHGRWRAAPTTTSPCCCASSSRTAARSSALCAAGILIRVLAPLLGDKRAEPPVVALADDGSCAVPLLGGHRGANRLAREIAEALGGQAAITTAGDVRFGLALDAPPPGWPVRNPAAAKAVMSALLAGETVALRLRGGRCRLARGGRRPVRRRAARSRCW